MTSRAKDVWSCKIGFANGPALPMGSDFPMRRAVADAFERLTGKQPDFIFSGWGAELTEGQQQIVGEHPGEDPMDAEYVVGATKGRGDA